MSGPKDDILQLHPEHINQPKRKTSMNLYIYIVNTVFKNKKKFIKSFFNLGVFPALDRATGIERTLDVGVPGIELASDGDGDARVLGLDRFFWFWFSGARLG